MEILFCLLLHTFFSSLLLQQGSSLHHHLLHLRAPSCRKEAEKQILISRSVWLAHIATMPAQHKPSPAKRKANGSSTSTPPQKKKATRANDDGFIMTLDSDDEVEDLDAANADAADGADASESEPEPKQDAAPLTKNQRKRKEKAHLAGKEKIVESVAARSKANGGAGRMGWRWIRISSLTSFGDGSGADYAGEESNGWDMSVTGTRMHKRTQRGRYHREEEKDSSRLALPIDDEEEEDDDEEDASQDASDDLDDDIKFAEYGGESDEDEDDVDRSTDSVEPTAKSSTRTRTTRRQPRSTANRILSAATTRTPTLRKKTKTSKPRTTTKSPTRATTTSTPRPSRKKPRRPPSSPMKPPPPNPNHHRRRILLLVLLPLTPCPARPLVALVPQATPIQSRTIPSRSRQGHCRGAVTGSGKTAAFMIPPSSVSPGVPGSHPEAKTRVLVLAPTRELAIQCYSVGKSIAKFTDIRFCLCVGGLSVKSQEAELKLRPEVVIATPGRLIDHVRNSASFTLDDIEILVMDEADRMLEDGFADELNEIVKSCPKGARQTMLFSATMTDDVEQLVRLSLKRPVRLFVDPKRTTAKKLIQEFVRVRGTGTGGVAGADGLSGVGDEPSSSVGKKAKTPNDPPFSSRSARAPSPRKPSSLSDPRNSPTSSRSSLACSASPPANSTAICPKNSVSTRSPPSAMARPLPARHRLASRGLDIKGVQTVINYDMPGQFEAYLHRVGRTARAGRNGRAVTLVGEADRRMLKLASRNPPRSRSSTASSRHRRSQDARDARDAQARDRQRSARGEEERKP